MKTRLAILAMLVAFGLSGCYTEFATTGGNYGDYGSSNSYSPGYYTSPDSSYSYYDTTGAPIINNYYGNYYDYGYNYPYSYSNWNYNWFTPSPAWWYTTDWSFGLGWGWNSWGGYPYSFYGGFGWGMPYSYYSPYYSPYYYSPWWAYPQYYVYQPGGDQSTGRVRSSGDTRYGRDGYGGGTTPVPYGQAGAGATVGNTNSGAGATANTQPAPATRTRASSTQPPSTGTVEQPRPRTREYNPPPQQYPVPNSQPQAPPPNPQPRVRDNGQTRDGGGRSGDSSQGRSRGMVSSYRRIITPQAGQFWHPQRFQAERIMPTAQRQERLNYVPPVREPRSFAAPRVESMPRFEAPHVAPSFRQASPAAPAPARSASSSGSSDRSRH